MSTEATTTDVRPTAARSSATNGSATTSTPRATANRSTTPDSNAFRERISRGWAERDEALPALRESAGPAARRRAQISERWPGARVVVPAGSLKQRSNDTDYAFRAHSAFSHLTGWGADAEPGAVLVLEPTPEGHEAVLYFRERAGRDSDEFYANPEIGEFWIGPRPSLAHVAADLGIPARHLRELSVLGADNRTVVVREADAALTARLDEERLATARAMVSAGCTTAEARSAWVGEDARLEQDLSEIRLVKDGYEIAELRRAVDATAKGFDDVLANLGPATAHSRGERIVETTFHARARLEGNAVGYDTIAAAGPHACILHWTRNDGAVRDGDLMLLDAGVEVDSLYTADITRTVPVGGSFTEVQRRVYQAVLDAADAAFAIVRPGVTFRTVHETAMRVIAERTAEWGFLGMGVEEALAPEAQPHRRYMVHGTSHHLGLDVHDCAKARRELYLDGVLEEGMVFTIEPGLYFQPDDLTVPEEYRGIGVRIEDDVVVTADGAENLSAGIPRGASAVEAWVRGARR